jgi:hypothetical protein
LCQPRLANQAALWEVYRLFFGDPQPLTRSRHVCEVFESRVTGIPKPDDLGGFEVHPVLRRGVKGESRSGLGHRNRPSECQNSTFDHRNGTIGHQSSTPGYRAYPISPS